MPTDPVDPPTLDGLAAEARRLRTDIAARQAELRAVEAAYAALQADVRAVKAVTLMTPEQRAAVLRAITTAAPST